MRFLNLRWILVGVCLVLTPSGREACAASPPVRLVFLGDSLTDGYGVAREAAFPSLIQRKLKADGFEDVEVVNAGISGSTTASGASRLKWHLKKKPDLLILALGANDGLRGLALTETRKNLAGLLTSAKREKITVLLAGMKLPPSYGQAYATGFENIFRDLAREYRVALMPFLLEGVAGEKGLNLADGIHPNEAGHRKIAENLYPRLRKLLRAPQ